MREVRAETLVSEMTQIPSGIVQWVTIGVKRLNPYRVQDRVHIVEESLEIISNDDPR